MARNRTVQRKGGEEERIVPGTVLWDAQYLEHRQRYEFAAAQLGPGMRVLDAGCGVGYGSALLAESGAEQVVAVDVSTDALAVARSRFADARIVWIAEDCERLEQAGRLGPFGLVCNLENLEHLPDPAMFLGRIVEVLSPNGVLITSTPNRIGTNRLRGVAPDAPSPNPFHFREYSIAEFRELLRRFFDDVSLHFQTLDPTDRMLWEPMLLSLWQNPMMRFGRLVRRIIRGHGRTGHLEYVLPARKYQILDTNPGDERVITQLAVCRHPRRKSA
jgi:SAM-dependent methyltransferase